MVGVSGYGRVGVSFWAGLWVESNTRNLRGVHISDTSDLMRRMVKSGSRAISRESLILGLVSE